MRFLCILGSPSPNPHVDLEALVAKPHAYHWKLIHHLFDLYVRIDLVF